jgi:hypothetical protein
MKIFVFDVDGTVANIEHRRAYVASKPKNWAAFNAGMKHDTPYGDIVWLAKTVRDSEPDAVLLVCSGRGEESRQVTTTFIGTYIGKFDKLYMRAEKDYRSDDIVKTELLEQIREEFGEPFLWFDDRNQVVDAIRAQDVRVLQVAPGNF